MKEVLLKDYKKPDYQIPEVELYVDIRDENVYVKSKLSVKLDGDNSNAPLILNGRDLKIVSIKINGEIVNDYIYKDDLLTLNSVPDNFTFEAEVEIDPYNNKSMEGFYKSGNILCTQNESEGFRRITFFTDRPDVMSKFTITLEGDKTKFPKLLGNGNLVETKELGNNRYSNKWEDPFEKPCYLFAMVAGELDLIEDSFTTMSNREIKLEIYTDPGKSSQAWHAMESLKKSMKWDEETFGLEYDLDLYMVVAVDSFNAGAMENKGLNIFNSVYVLADPESATDSDFESIEGVIGHEYFHNWTGNRVTCRDWFQLTLKEGLTVFRDQEFSSDMTDRDVKRIEDVSVLRTHQFAEDKGPNSHPIKPASYMAIDNFYTLTVYEKGAEVIRMIHTLIGKENFRKGMDLYFKRHTGQAVTTADFVAAMADASGVDLTQFKLWYSQAGTPIVDVDSEYKDGEFTLKVKQSLPETSYSGSRDAMYFPFNIGLYSKSGRDLTPAESKQLIVSKEYQEFTFKVSEEVVPSLLQGFSAPVIINYNYSIEDLITLLKYDKDLFNKFDAARRLTMFNIKEIENGKKINPEIVEAYKNLLTDKNIDKRIMAKLLYIPDVRDIAATMDEYDYVKANQLRKDYIVGIATELKSILFRLFEDNVSTKYEFNKEAVGKRSIKNKSLYILGYLDNEIEEIAFKQFTTADNMTDYMASYSVLQNCSDEARLKANKMFYDKWKDNFLVMNKWFSVQATRDNDAVLDEIIELSKDPIFDNSNPNRIRSLFTVFGRANLSQFHKEDGSSYKFITDKMLEIDKFNSHASSHIADSFQAYKYLPKKQAELMKEQLDRAFKVEGISTPLYEILSKTLKARG